MTTLPSRIHLARAALESLLAQSRVPDRIYLSVPDRSEREACEYEIPDWLDALTATTPIEIVRIGHDYGPGTKLIGCLSKLHPDDVVVLLDDDMGYRRYAIEVASAAIESGSGAASFYVYPCRGLTVGQGADCFALSGEVALRCARAIPLVLEWRPIRLHDDVWISFELAKQGVRIESLAEHLPPASHGRIWESVHFEGGLSALGGELSRPRLNKQVTHLLFKYGDPTVSMRARRAMRLGHRGVEEGLRHLGDAVRRGGHSAAADA
jgi:hypothetical protein